MSTLPILERATVRERYEAALAEQPQAPESALVSTAQALCLPVEAVAECLDAEQAA